MANNDGGQGWVVANIPYDLISVIMHRAAQRTRTVLYDPPVTASCDGLEARVGITVGCDESGNENEDSRGRISFAPPQVHVLRTDGLQYAEAA